MTISVVITESFDVIGSQLRTTNKNNQAFQEIPAFWQNFFGQNMHNTIPNQIDHGTLYAVYTDYDPAMVAQVAKTKVNVVPEDYSFTVASQVSSFDSVPDGMISKTIPSGRYAVVRTQGAYPDALLQGWHYIWSSEFPYTRAYTIDFEKYDHRVFTGADGSIIDIYIAIL